MCDIAVSISLFSADVVDRFSCGDHDQQTPQVISIVEIREPAKDDAFKKAFERHLHGILFVSVTAIRWIEPESRQTEQPGVVTLLERLGRLMFAIFELANPATD